MAKKLTKEKRETQAIIENDIANFGNGSSEASIIKHDLAQLKEDAGFIMQEAITCKLAKRKTHFKLAPRNKPVMAPEMEEEIEAVMVQYNNRGQWRNWGMEGLRKQGAALLLHGPSGTGKTTIARYISKRIGRGILTCNMKDVGGGNPGDCERGLAEVFETGKLQNDKTIYFDECEALLWDRSRAGGDSMWMVGVVDEILMQTTDYKGCIIFATNKLDLIDSALLTRCFAVLQIGLPEHPERVRLWEQKIPPTFPLQLTVAQRDKLAAITLTGRAIENAICKEASLAILQKRNPAFQSLLQIADKLK